MLVSVPSGSPRGVNHPLNKLPPARLLRPPPWHGDRGPEAVLGREELRPQLPDCCVPVPGHHLAAVLVVVSVLDQRLGALQFLS